jgi:hypothetical protein
VPARSIGTAQALDALGRHEEAEHTIALAEQKWGAAMAYQISYFYAGRKDADRAFAWLERAYRQHDGGLPNLKVDIRLTNLRQDPKVFGLAAQNESARVAIEGICEAQHASSMFHSRPFCPDGDGGNAVLLRRVDGG